MILQKRALHLSLLFDGIISRRHYEFQPSLNTFSASRQEADDTSTQMTEEKWYYDYKELDV